MKVSIVIPVYYNEDNLMPLYKDIKEKFIDAIDYEYEIVMVNDGSKDNSYGVMQKLAVQDPNIKIVSLSRNFGSHAAILCGLEKCTGDCAVVKAADLQEPTELILKMVESWKKGKDVRCQIIAKLKDPDAVNGQTERWSANNVWHTELPVVNWEKGGIVEEETSIGFTPSDLQNLDQIAA